MSNRPIATAPAAPDGAAVESPIIRWRGDCAAAVRESIVVERPLAVEIAYERQGQPVIRLLSVTMRTPGNDAELALGFLYCEAIIARAADVVAAGPCAENARGEKIDTWRANLAAAPRSQAVERVSRGIITSAACGLCGRTTLEGLRLRPAAAVPLAPPVSAAEILAMAASLGARQLIYPQTGGCHGAGLFSPAGEALVIREDVGRHNAVDKVIGAAVAAGLGMAGATLVLSGRAGFELVQKAAAAGASLVVSVGAPTSLSIRMAAESGVTLVGFARDGRFNVYTQAGRHVAC